MSYVLSYLQDLKNMIEDITEPEERAMSKALLVLISALALGTNVEKLVQATGYSQEYVNGVASRMREAGLWTDEKFDAQEWRDDKGEFVPYGQFRHVMVALGEMTRTVDASGCFYTETESGAVEYVWVDLGLIDVDGIRVN